MGIFEHYQQKYEHGLQEEYSLQEYLDLCRDDPSAMHRLQSACYWPSANRS